MRPVVHISFPVLDLHASVQFYSEVLSAQVGRRTDAFADIFLFGAQVTLQNDPPNVPDPMPRTRHFGATLSWSDFEVLLPSVIAAARVVEEPTPSYVGQPTEQIKVMIADPSGNLIEIKAYRHPEVVLSGLTFK